MTNFITSKANSIALVNEERITAELDAVQARARTRTISYADLVRVAADAEKRLENVGVCR